ncbi:HupE/UreJ family protein [Haloferula sp.]|uniref:HupE/UreJ family protein n=1 Tax=Haloferula sp. TaxID=2497595 RepID=UPI003C75D7A3
MSPTRHLIAILLCGWALLGVAKAHVVEQLFAEVKRGGPDWEIEVLFDAGYAKAEWRGDPDTPQPTREWLVGLSPEEQLVLCEEASAYLDECLSFVSNKAPVKIAHHFIDFDQSPPDFPTLLNDGAYLRIRLTPSSSDDRFLTECRLAAGKRPDFVFKSSSGDDSEPTYLTLKPGDSFVLHPESTISGVTQSGRMIEGQSVYLYSLEQGFLHVLPGGLDHILFILTLFLLQRRWKPLLWQSLAFTVAHTLTLGLTAAGFIAPKGSGVEALIALSIAVLAMENLFKKDVTSWRIVMVFGFGLIHGMGFATALSSVLTPGEGFLGRLVVTNLGVELAQITILALAWILTAKWHDSPRYQIVRIALNISIAVVAAVWLIQRFSFSTPPLTP